MGDPELHSDEKILLTTQDVFVKSIPFEAILTNKRIILLDRKKNLIPQKDILLATVGDIVAAENAIRDQTITLSLITSSGETRQLVLTFSRTAGGGRKRERDEWTKTLKEMTSSSIQKTIRKVVPSFEPEARKSDTVPKKKVMEQPPSRIEITRQAGVRKEIEGVRPMKTSLEPEPAPRRTIEPEPVARKVIEPEPVIRRIIEPEYTPQKSTELEPAVRRIFEPDSLPPKPVETSSLPVGTFCTRCGNRVPPDSVFCNRCGSRVLPTEEQERVPAEPAVPQVAVESRIPAPKISALERKERPIEKEIQSIEPLIEGSVPRTSEAPPIPSTRPVEPVVEQQNPATTESTSIAQAAQSIIDAVTPGSAPVIPGAVPGTVPPEGGTPGAAPAPKPATAGAPVAAPPVPPSPPSGGRKIALIVVGILVILAIASVGFLFWNNLSGGNGTAPEPTVIATETPTATPTPTRTPVPTTITAAETTVAVQTTPQVLVPETGVWIRVTYANTFKGSAGLAGSQEEVGGTGDKFYMVATSGGIVEAAVQKVDGSGEELVVRVYKDGELVKTGSTTAPKGTVELQVDLRPVTPTTTAAKTTTAAATNASETS